MVSFNPALAGVSNIKYKSYGASEKKFSVEINLKPEVHAFLSDTFGVAETDMNSQNVLAGLNTGLNHLPADLKDRLVYNGRPISDFSPEEASALISEDGHFGVKKTSQRISSFVISSAGEDLETLKAGREGVLRGFKAAEKAWGGELPDISYETLEKTLAAIDDRIKALGGSVVDLTA